MRALFTLVFSFFLAITFAKDIDVHPDNNIIKDNKYYYNSGSGITNTVIAPGDRLILKHRNDANHTRNKLQLNNIHGTKENPIIITHPSNDYVQINDPAANATYGIYLNNCTHIIIEGGRNDVAQNSSLYYGIQIKLNVNGQSIKAENGSSFLTINRVFVDAINAVGTSPAILIKSNTQCKNGVARFSENTFLLQDVTVSNNYIKNAGSEAIYIGETGNGIEVPCQEKVSLKIDFNNYTGKLVEVMPVQADVAVDRLFPHYLDNVLVINNLIENSGWDGMQLSWCHNLEVKDNVVLNYGTKNHKSQNHGIVIGRGSSGTVYNNYISSGQGNGIQGKPSGNLWVFNNILINCGKSAPSDVTLAAINMYAEYIDFKYARGKNVVGEKSINITHNFVYQPLHVGIRLNSAMDTFSTKTPNPAYYGDCIGNVIVQRAKGTKEYAAVQSQSSDLDINPAYPIYKHDSIITNYFSYRLSDLKLKNTQGSNPYFWDYRPTTGSPLIDKVPLRYENTQYSDYYEQTRGPFVIVPKLREIMGAGYRPDMGPAERVLPYITINPRKLFDIDLR